MIFEKYDKYVLGNFLLVINEIWIVNLIYVGLIIYVILCNILDKLIKINNYKFYKFLYKLL